MNLNGEQIFYKRDFRKDLIELLSDLFKRVLG